MSKPKVTRTYGPIHFEDLEPHRFEDLIRELIYDFKDWQSIEATGRSGNDDGFDIRAYERAEITSITDNEGNEEVEQTSPMEGNLWMIQGKREKEIGPKKIKAIISDIDVERPPYGYILAAPVNFSKDSYDLFREELRKKGVMEFYLWGKAELEDTLHLPKNDRILFTFFGISLTSKRKARTTEIRLAVGVKNKLYKSIGEANCQFYRSILIRDLKDTNYPYEKEYSDFKTKPRWKEYVAYAHHPLGLWCHNHKYFAYIDTEKKEWDFTKIIDLVPRERKAMFSETSLVNDFWDFLPQKNKGYFIIDCLLKYSDIVIVDDKGDVHYNLPHIYVDFSIDNGPFAGYNYILNINNKEIELTEEYKQIRIFPKEFKKENFGKIYKEKKILLDIESQGEFQKYLLNTVYDVDGKYDFLNSRDVIQIDSKGTEIKENFIQITHKFKAIVKDYVKQSIEPYKTKRSIELQLGRIPTDNEEINIYEFKRINKGEIESNK